MTERERIMQDMERVAFPIYKPTGRDVMVLSDLYDADYRKADEVRKETLIEAAKWLDKEWGIGSLLLKEFGVEVDE